MLLLRNRSLRLPANLLAVLLTAATASAQDLSEAAFCEALTAMGNDLRLLCVAAHPDDEDGATLACYRMQYGVETHAVIATRGEGGQNEIGPELYHELGVIRTREMMAAAAITGARLHFLNLPEFGYSKSAEETFAVWGREETLRRVVRIIREVRPQVIITHHGRQQDHGHHQAIGAAVLEAFSAAADPAVFPEQIGAGLEAWQVSRLYIRAWQPGTNSTQIDISVLDPLRGMTYAEVAAKALEEHRSQGMGFFIERYLTGRPKVYYDLVKEADIPAERQGTLLDASAGPLFEGLVDSTSPALRAAERVPARPNGAGCPAARGGPRGGCAIQPAGEPRRRAGRAGASFCTGRGHPPGSGTGRSL